MTSEDFCTCEHDLIFIEPGNNLRCAICGRNFSKIETRKLKEESGISFVRLADHFDRKKASHIKIIKDFLMAKRIDEYISAHTQTQTILPSTPYVLTLKR